MTKYNSIIAIEHSRQCMVRCQLLIYTSSYLSNLIMHNISKVSLRWIFLCNTYFPRVSNMVLTLCSVTALLGCGHFSEQFSCSKWNDSKITEIIIRKCSYEAVHISAADCPIAYNLVPNRCHDKTILPKGQICKLFFCKIHEY